MRTARKLITLSMYTHRFSVSDFLADEILVARLAGAFDLNFVFNKHNYIIWVFILLIFVGSTFLIILNKCQDSDS